MIDPNPQQDRESEFHNIIFYHAQFDTSLLPTTLHTILSSYFSGDSEAYQYYSPRDTKYHVYHFAFSLYNPNFPTSLRPICEDYLKFFIQKLDSYQPVEEGSISQRWMFLNNIRHLREGSEFQRRWFRGLVRPGAIRIVEAWMRASLHILTRLLEARADEFEVIQACRRTWLPALIGERLRSERVELLFARYLDEEGFNSAVSNGIEHETRKFEASIQKARDEIEEEFQLPGPSVVKLVLERYPEYERTPGFLHCEGTVEYFTE